MFFRLAKLLSDPILPLFVFNGPKRPTWKRGIQVSKRPHWMIRGMKSMISAFGFEWREVCVIIIILSLNSESVSYRSEAPGEAEAELAYLNRVGVIDGILSDDADNFLFGALTVIRKCEFDIICHKLLLTAQQSRARSSGQHCESRSQCCRQGRRESRADLQSGQYSDGCDGCLDLCRPAGFILIGLLSGGDYEVGLQT